MTDATQAATSGCNGKDDPLYPTAVAVVRAFGKPSVATLQRHLRIGYNRAAALLEAMVGSVIDHTGPTGKVLPERTRTPR